jgi:hypothetical protein
MSDRSRLPGIKLVSGITGIRAIEYTEGEQLLARNPCGVGGSNDTSRWANLSAMVLSNMRREFCLRGQSLGFEVFSRCPSCRFGGSCVEKDMLIDAVGILASSFLKVTTYVSTLGPLCLWSPSQGLDMLDRYG